MLLLLLLIGGGSYAWGEEVTSTFVASKNYTAGMTLACSEKNAMSWVTSAKPTGIDPNNRGIQWSKTATTLTSTYDESSVVSKVVVTVASNSSLNDQYLASVSVGGVSYGSQKITKDLTGLEFTGNSSGKILVTTSKGSKSTYIKSIVVTVEGGDTPSLNVNTTSVDFGAVEQNAAVDAKTVSVSLKNVTSANVKLTGEGASAFEVSPAVLTASDDVTITPKTTTVGTYTAKLEISADGAETQSVDVSMTVREPFDGSVWEIKVANLNKTASGSGYAAYKGEHAPVGDFAFYTSYVMPGYGEDDGKLQFQRNTGFLYNTTSFSNIVKIELETSSTFTVYVGKAEHPEAQEVKGTSVNGVFTYSFPEGNGYFTIKNGDKTGYISSIKVYYTSPSETTYTANTLTFKASNKEGNWATFSNDDVTFFNDDVIVNTVVVENNSLVSLPLDKTTANIGGKEVKGYYVPAKTGVLIYSIGETVTYYVVKNKEVAPVDGDFNMLKPASEKMTEGFKFYKLAYDNYTEKTGLGFYWGAAEGGAFTVKPGLAYLAVPQAQAANVKGFSFDGTQTGINGVEATTAKGAIYNLNGQRVEKAQRGIYIQNGKKFIVK